MFQHFVSSKTNHVDEIEVLLLTMMVMLLAMMMLMMMVVVRDVGWCWW
jgi:hypothetical protein